MARQAVRSQIRPSSKAAPSRGRKPARVVLDDMTTEQKLRHLLAERETLLTRIASLEAEVARCHSRQAEVADRLTWALDGLKEILAAGK